MIHVEQRPPPDTFDDQVRIPGLRAIAELRGDSQALSQFPVRPGPKRKPVPELAVEDLHPYWTACLDDLHCAYGGVCAYLAIYIPKCVGARTVDHFNPKKSCLVMVSIASEQIYEWQNYRLACSLMNSRKGEFQDILDPFQVQDGWFHLEFSGLQTHPNPELSPDLRAQIKQTIDRLGLNDKDCVDVRREYYDDYIRREFRFSYLARKSPFVAKEVARQGFCWDEES